MKLFKLAKIFTLSALCFQLLSATAFAGSLLYTGINAAYASKGSSDNSAFGVYLGTDLIPLVGFEGGYMNFGSFSKTDYSSYYIAAKPHLGLGPLQLYLKGGINMYYMDPSFGKSDNGVDLMYGAGADFFLTDMFSLGASYTKFGFDGDDVDTFSLTATIHFL